MDTLSTMVTSSEVEFFFKSVAGVTGVAGVVFGVSALVCASRNFCHVSRCFAVCRLCAALACGFCRFSLGANNKRLYLPFSYVVCLKHIRNERNKWKMLQAGLKTCKREDDSLATQASVRKYRNKTCHLRKNAKHL